MPPKLSQQSSSNGKPAKKTKAKATTIKFDAPPPNSQRINPLTAFANTPLTSSADGVRKAQPGQSQKSKGKEKEKVKERPTSVLGETVDDRLWVDIYEPTTEAELAVHVKKVQDVRRWLDEAFVGGPSGKLRKYRRILALTGPAGTAKTATIRVLARELDFEILEWRNAMGEAAPSHFGVLDASSFRSTEDDTLFSKFEAFLARASTCLNIFTDMQALDSTAKPSSSSHSQSSSPSPTSSPVPVVIIVSDAGMRGEASDERLANGSWGKDRDGVLDDLLHGPYVTQIGRPSRLLCLLSFSSTKSGGSAPVKEMLDIIIETSNGDIRSAIMALQFSCVVEMPGGKGRKKGSAGEQSLHLFHLIGKVLYNKRKGDPPNPSATAKDIQKDKDLDAALKDPTEAAFLLGQPCTEDESRERRRYELLYADSPIDSSLFSLYIHQNYSQFCNQVEECEGREAWYQANPHRFHLLTMGTLHSLPMPVPRRNQKLFKPETQWDAVRDVRGWIFDDATSRDGEGLSLGGWSRTEVVTELGGVLKARDAKYPARSQPPSSHRLFSSLQFVPGGESQGLRQLGEGDVSIDNVDVLDDEGGPPGGWSESAEDVGGGWLENDDIEEF
ncbi:Rad17 cell cycle checkpoint protein-domain-containing protein [Mycena galericulata]|nr:Rad17 cell cycle checkpoint protein-domain-containing protein [Mycena galericulata]